MGYNYLFTNVDVSVFRRSDGSLAFKGVLDGKLYLVDVSKEEVDLDACLIAKTNMGSLWHHRLAHVGLKNLHKLLKGDHVLGLTDICFEKDRPCATCQAGKQVGSTHHNKNVMTTSRPLELLHTDLFGPVAYLSIEGSKYGLVIVDDCWGLVLKCYESRTRQHKMLNIKALHPSDHYFPSGIMNLGRRS
jgi:hypothetical protein